MEKLDFSKLEDNDWRKRLHIAMEEVRPAEWYYAFVDGLLEKEKNLQKMRDYLLAESAAAEGWTFDRFLKNWAKIVKKLADEI